MSGTHRDIRESLGWYALGRTDPDETTRIRAHLDGCADCRAELSEVERTLRRLSAVDADRLDDVPPVPAGLGDLVVQQVLDSRVAQREPGRARLLLVAAAVAVLALGIGIGIGWWVHPEPEVVAAPPTEPVAVTVIEPDIHASAQLINHTWGVEIQLTADGFADGESFRVELISTAGDRSSAGEFVGTGSAPMVCNLNSSVLRPEAAGFEILDEQGTVLLTSSFS